MISPDPLPAQDVVLAPDRWNRAALEWIQLLKNGSFDEAGSRVDPAVPEGAMGPAQLRAIWNQVSAQLGELQAIDPGTVTEQGEYHLVDLPARFQNQAVVLRVVLTDSLLVSGFFLRPPEPPRYEPPAYVDPHRFREEEVTVGADPWSLPGTLALPAEEGSHPAVVLVHGSGPNDRDETIGGIRPFRDLAWGLASRGVAVLRYEKRTKVYPSQVPADIGLEEEVISDALAALATVRDRPEVDADRVFVLGHSLGGILAPEIAVRDGEVAGVMVLAATARPFFDVLTSQLEYIAGLEADPDSPASRQLDSLLALVEGVRQGDVPDDQRVLGAPPPYWREVARVDPVATAREVSAPLLILQGGRDYQSTEEDLRAWEQGLDGKEGVSFRFYPSLNHLFVQGTGMATPEEYVSGGGHVSEEVIADLAEWIATTKEPG